LSSRTRLTESTSPRVTHIIACRNEEGRIRTKLENALAIRYPILETIVASDASDDRSDAIVAEYSNRGVRLIRSPERRGKEFAQKLAVGQATGDIIVFSDAGTNTPPESIEEFVEAFADPTVGAVSSEDSFVSDDGNVVGEGAYVRYEMWLRREESRVNSLIGLSGSFFGVRRPVALLLDETIPSDFASGINTYRLGYRAITEPRIRGVYRDIKDPRNEFGRKVRTALRGMAALARIPEVLNPGRYGLFAWQVWSHKVMRWLVPWFMLGLIVSTAVLARHSLEFRAFLSAQLIVYVVAMIGHLLPATRRVAVIRLTCYFFQANAALLVAAIRFLWGHRVVTWNPSVR
jgi:Glycosyl transferase family 2